MLVIYYNSMNHKSGKRLQEVIETHMPKKKIETCQTIEELSERFHRFELGNIKIAVLLIDSIAEINQIYSIKRLSNDIRIIMILPNRSSELTSSCFKLYPRFISYIDDDFKDVGLVLSKMIKISDKSSGFNG